MSVGNNVLLFPSDYNLEPTSLDEVRERMDIIREVFVEAAAEAITSVAIDSARAAGYPIDDYEQGREIALVQEALKSLMMASRCLHHDLQDTAAKMFDLIDRDEWLEEAEE